MSPQGDSQNDGPLNQLAEGGEIMKYRFYVNPDLCTGCRTCELACSFTHAVDNIRAETRIYPIEGGFDELWVPVVCLQCEDAACVKSCLVDALKRNPVTGAIELKKSANVSARAFKTDWAASGLVSGFFEITGTMALPKFSLKPGTFVNAQDLIITCATPGSSIHYTIDGTDPGEDSPLYSGTIRLAKSTVIKARACRKDWMIGSGSPNRPRGVCVP